MKLSRTNLVQFLGQGVR